MQTIEQKRQYNRERYYRNREKILLQVREYAAKNQDRKTQYNKQYWRKNKARLTEYNRMRYARDHAVLIRKNREHYARNRERYIAYQINKYKTDPVTKIAQNARRTLYKRLRAKNISKNTHTSELIGCSFAFLKIWIEHQFAPKMNWGNHGSYWHIDHRLPLASFNLQDPKQLRQAFHFLNLEPMRAKENISKSDRITDPQLNLSLNVE